MNRHWSAKCVKGIALMFRRDNTHLFTNASTARGRLYQASLETQLVKRWTCSRLWPRPGFSLMQILMYVTRQSLRSAALRWNGPLLCVDIPATHKWPSISNPRNVDANAFDNVSTGSSLALTLAMSYHTDCTFRPTLSLALTNFSGVLMFDDRASSEKTSVRREWAEKTFLLRDRRLSTSSKAHFINASSADGRNPRPGSLVSVRAAEMEIVDTSPPNTSIFFPLYTGLPDVSDLERRGSPDESATVLINRNHSATSRVCSWHQWQSHTPADVT